MKLPKIFKSKRQLEAEDDLERKKFLREIKRESDAAQRKADQIEKEKNDAHAKALKSHVAGQQSTAKHWLLQEAKLESEIGNINAIKEQLDDTRMLINVSGIAKNFGRLIDKVHDLTPGPDTVHDAVNTLRDYIEESKEAGQVFKERNKELAKQRDTTEAGDSISERLEQLGREAAIRSSYDEIGAKIAETRERLRNIVEEDR